MANQSSTLLSLKWAAFRAREETPRGPCSLAEHWLGAPPTTGVAGITTSKPSLHPSRGPHRNFPLARFPCGSWTHGGTPPVVGSFPSCGRLHPLPFCLVSASASATKPLIFPPPQSLLSLLLRVCLSIVTPPAILIEEIRESLPPFRFHPCPPARCEGRCPLNCDPSTKATPRETGPTGASPSRHSFTIPFDFSGSTQIPFTFAVDPKRPLEGIGRLGTEYHKLDTADPDREFPFDRAHDQNPRPFDDPSHTRPR